MSSNPVYRLFASPRSFAPSILRGTLAAILFLEVTRAALLALGIAHWRGDWESALLVLYNHFIPVLTSPFVITRIVFAAGLILGIFTRIWGLLTVILAVCGYQLHDTLEPGFPLENLVAIVGIGLALVCWGGGRVSMDRRISQHFLPKIG